MDEAQARNPVTFGVAVGVLLGLLVQLATWTWFDPCRATAPVRPLEPGQHYAEVARYSSQP